MMINKYTNFKFLHDRKSLSECISGIFIIAQNVIIVASAMVDVYIWLQYEESVDVLADVVCPLIISLI